MPIFDAHCHLDQLSDPPRLIQRAKAAGVLRILAVSEDSASGKKVLDLKARFPGCVLAGLGIHPMLTVRLSPDDMEADLRFIGARLEEADVLGEVGLDFKHARTEEQQTFQRSLLDRMLGMAKEAAKPVNLHSRWAQRQTMEAAIRYKRETGHSALMHWFTSSKKLVRICAEEGLFVSVGPSVLVDGPACDVALQIPKHLLLIETDSPVPFAGEPAEPAWAARVLSRMAELLNVDASTLEGILNDNFDRYLENR